LGTGLQNINWEGGGKQQVYNTTPTYWDKIFAKDTSDKGLLHKIHYELLKLNNKKKNNKILKMGQRQPTKEDIEMTPYAIRKMQMKMTVRTTTYLSEWSEQ
jgi:hypothetical protein